MKTTTLFFAIITMAAMISCTGGNRNTGAQQTACQATETTCTSDRQRPDWLSGVPPDMHTSEMVLDFFGTYKGVLPSASGEGIKTTVTLNEDRTFVLLREYIGREEDAKFVFEGDYTIEFGEIVVLDLGAQGEMFFDLREGSLALLDNQMNRIERAPFEPRYPLRMVDSGIIWYD